jgi:hypothetical protein
MNPMLSGLDGFEGEQGIKIEQLERFPSVDWSKCASPPMTPGKFGLSRLGVSFPEFIYPAGNSCMKIKTREEQHSHTLLQGHPLLSVRFN